MLLLNGGCTRSSYDYETFFNNNSSCLFISYRQIARAFNCKVKVERARARKLLIHDGRHTPRAGRREQPASQIQLLMTLACYEHIHSN